MKAPEPDLGPLKKRDKITQRTATTVAQIGQTSREKSLVLTLNAGSSSLKFALFHSGAAPVLFLSGAIDRIGSPEAAFTLRGIASQQTERPSVPTPDHASCLEYLLKRLEETTEADGFRAAGHGFHGLSYEFLMEQLAHFGDPAATKGRVILAHLGNGASLAAVRDGKCIDTSMAFTPAAGLVMGRRSGDLDPGLVAYLARTEGMTAEQFYEIVNCHSGLLGVSEISSDMRELLALENTDTRAAEAVALFCYQAKKWIGAFAAALGGLDTLVFSGGIGENNPSIRRRICDGLGFLGLELNEARNAENAAQISADGTRATVRVIRMDEELMIARSVCRVLGLGLAC